MQQIIDEEELRIESNYFRELLYNLEHCIHHQALIKVAILQVESITIGRDFGVARSTIGIASVGAYGSCWVLSRFAYSLYGAPFYLSDLSAGLARSLH